MALTPKALELIDLKKSNPTSYYKELGIKEPATNKTLTDTVQDPTYSPITADYTPSMSVDEYLNKNYTPEAQTIMGRYEQARRGVSDAAAYSRQLTESNAGAAISSEYAQGEREIKSQAEARRGFATSTALLRETTAETRKRVSDLERNMNELLLQNKHAEASQLSDLILKEQTSLTEARTNFLNEYFNIENLRRGEAEFQLNKQQAQQEGEQAQFQGRLQASQERRLASGQEFEQGIASAEEARRALSYRSPEEAARIESMQNLAVQYPDAGITMNDTLESSANKVRNSQSYQLNRRAAEADIAQSYASTAYAKAQTNKLLSDSASSGGLDSSSSPLMSQPSYGLLNAKQRTQADSVNNLITALNDYKSYMKQTTGGFGQNLFGSDAAVLQTKLNAIIFAAAQAEGTGALQQADREVITRMIPDPTSGSGAWNVMRTGGLQGSINKIDDQINKYTGQLNNYGLQPGYQLMQQQSGVQQGPALTINPINGSYTMPSSTAQTLTSTVRAPDGNDIIIID